MMFVLKAEFLKFLYDIKKYRFNYTMGLISIFIFLLGLYWGAGEISKNSGGATLFIGLILWIFASDSISDASNHLFEERYYGTIEQLSITKYSLLSIFMARFLAVFVFSLLEIVFLGLPLYFIFSPDLGVFFSNFRFTFISIIVTISLIITLYGFGLFLAAIGLKFKKVGALSGIIRYLILFFSGIIIPYDSMPYFLKIISSILPMGIGIRALSGLEKGIVYTHLVLFCALYSLLILFAGIILFRMGIRHVKKTGEYSAY